MSETLAGMRKAQEYLDGKRTRGEDSIIRDLLSAVEKVLELHQPETLHYYDDSEWVTCAGCSSLAPHERRIDYPCPTVQAIQEALGGER